MKKLVWIACGGVFLIIAIAAAGTSKQTAGYQPSTDSEFSQTMQRIARDHAQKQREIASTVRRISD